MGMNSEARGPCGDVTRRCSYAHRQGQVLGGAKCRGEASGEGARPSLAGRALRWEKSPSQGHRGMAVTVWLDLGVQVMLTPASPGGLVSPWA